MLHIISKENGRKEKIHNYDEIAGESGIYQSTDSEYAHLRFISNGEELVIYVNLSDEISWGKATDDNTALTFIKVNESITFE